MKVTYLHASVRKKMEVTYLALQHRATETNFSINQHVTLNSSNIFIYAVHT
jgi:hypothetical protein